MQQCCLTGAVAVLIIRDAQSIDQRGALPATSLAGAFKRSRRTWTKSSICADGDVGR